MTDVFVSFLRIVIIITGVTALVLGAISFKGGKRSKMFYQIGEHFAVSMWVVALIETIYLAMLRSGCLG